MRDEVCVCVRRVNDDGDDDECRGGTSVSFTNTDAQRCVPCVTKPACLGKGSHSNPRVHGDLELLLFRPNNFSIATAAVMANWQI